MLHLADTRQHVPPQKELGKHCFHLDGTAVDIITKGAPGRRRRLTIAAWFDKMDKPEGWGDPTDLRSAGRFTETSSC